MVGGGCCGSCLPVSPGPGQVLVTCNQRKFAHDSRAGLGWAGLVWEPSPTLCICICSHIWVYLFFQVCSCVVGAGPGQLW